jgi:hypothetical protein
MTRQQKIAILQAIAKGGAPPETINGPQMQPVIFMTEPGQYPVGDGRVLDREQFEKYCAEIEKINRFFPDFQTGPPIVFKLDERFAP